MPQDGREAGSYFDADGTPHGFVRRHHTITTIDCPGAVATIVDGVNNRGQVVVYVRPDGRIQAFKAGN